MTRNILVPGSNRPLLVPGGSTLRHPEFQDLAAWTHCWDFKDAVTYVPDATERSNFGITTANRVLSVADRGTGSGTSGKLPLWRDTVNYGTIYGAPAQLPGPLHIQSSARFNGKPAVRFDSTAFAGPNGNLRAMLSPMIRLPLQADPTTWFNPSSGYAQPYTVVMFGRGAAGFVDSTLGSDGTGPTLGMGAGGGFGTSGKWCVACWGLNSHSPPYYLNTTHDVSANETVLGIVRCDGTNSILFFQWRDSSGVIQNTAVSGQLDPWPYKELFMGWVDPHDYIALLAIKVGGLTLTEVNSVLTYCAKYTPAAGSIATEP